MSSKSLFIFGTPKGHANTQLLQATQRGLRAVCTTPSAVRLIASAGQTSAHVGVSQCMHTTGTVCGETARSTNSKMNHRMTLVRIALAARFDARLAADAAIRVDEKEFLAGFATIRFLLLWFALASIFGLALGGPNAHGAHFVLGNLRDRILGGDRQLIDASSGRPNDRERTRCRGESSARLAPAA